MIILTDEAAGVALDEVGQLQQAIEQGDIDIDGAGDMLVERIDAVATLYSDSTTMYTALVEPILKWAIYSIAPKFLVDQDSTAESREYRALFSKISATNDRWKHLGPPEGQ